ncbi:MAG: response regulator [Thermoplasmatales archaeon]|nr:response regulator [Thermoplasmatales archaeon]
MIKEILFVDDDEEILEAAKTSLEVYGYKVNTAKSGKECLEKIDRADIVFLDIKMPGMDGIETLKEIKKRREFLPVIMITAYATVDTAIEAMKEGASDYIRKPFNFEELEKSILAVIEDIKFKKMEEFHEEDYIDIFLNLAKERKGICIAREFNALKGAQNIKIIPLERELKPRKIEEIKKELEENMEENGVILLMNLEYILNNNNFLATREFLDWLNKKSASKNSKIIISANFEKVDAKERQILQDLIIDIHLGIFSESISNYIRRKIISLLSDGGSYPFTKIAQEIGIDDNPKLSFHLKKLKDDGVLEQDSEKRYKLSKIGKETAEFLKSMKENKMKKPFWMSFK